MKRFIFRLLDIRESGATRGWYWVKWGMKWAQHGGWFYFDASKPRATLGWWKRFAWDVPKQRGWRWG